MTSLANVILVAGTLTCAAALAQTASTDAPLTDAPQSLAYVLQADRLGTDRSQAVRRLAECGRDWIVIDASFDGSDSGAWSKEEIQAIRRGKAGRKVLAYLSIGEAEEYRPYWKAAWDADRNGKPDPAAPGFLLAENPDWEGNYKVRYWQDAWQRIILHALDRIMAQGFDGVYLDIVDAFEAFEYDPRQRNWTDHRRNGQTGRSFRQDMVAWVERIAQHARRTQPGFLVVPQNGAQLLENSDFLNTINAIGIEDLFTDGDRPQARDHVAFTLALLARMASARRPVLVIEYGRQANARSRSIEGARRNGFLLLVTDRDLTTLGQGIGPGAEPYGVGPDTRTDAHTPRR